MKKQKYSGDELTKLTAFSLIDYIETQTMDSSNELVKSVCKHILNKYPNLTRIQSKFDFQRSDLHDDLYLTLSDNKIIKINLFKIHGNGKIQPKNLGAKSFLEKYFNAPYLQLDFNQFMESELSKFYYELLENECPINNLTILRSEVNKKYPKFIPLIEEARGRFLFLIREKAFSLLVEEYNSIQSSLRNALENLLLIHSENIIVRYKDEDRLLRIEEFNLELPNNDTFTIYRKGRDSIGIALGNTALLIRFKFESNPASSIKLATSYEIFNSSNTNIKFNISSINKFEEQIKNHQQTIHSKNTSNAIGKCNEAMVYYQLLKHKPELIQTEETDYRDMIEQYSKEVSSETLQMIHMASTSAYNAINDYFNCKYSKVFVWNEIQLVPESYIQDSSDTTDLIIVLKVENQLVEERLSLKALRKKTKKITSKNPGIGTILGDQYFNVGTMHETVNETKEKYSNGSIDHLKSLRIIANDLGQKLQSATNEQLLRGIMALLGNATMVITFYGDNISLVSKHADISQQIQIRVGYPSPLNTSFFWNNNTEELSLRVKFSKNQSYGWSSIKLASEYKIL